MGSSSELSAPAKLLLADIYRRFYNSGEWPRYNAVLVDHFDLDPPGHEVMLELERDHLSVHRPITEASRCLLKVKALSVVNDAREDIANLIDVCRYLAKYYLERDKDAAAPGLVSGEQMVSDLSLYPLAAQRVFALLKEAFPQVTDLGGRDASDMRWPEFRVRSHAHHFRSVTTPEEFFKAEQRARGSYAADHALSPGHQELIDRLSPLGPRKPKVAVSSEGAYFVSHAAGDVDAASLIRDAIVSAHRGKPDVFVSTRPGAIPGGKPWLDEIRKRLDESAFVLVLLTPESVKRWWIWFEAGAAWLRDDKVMVPVLAGGLLSSEVPIPLRLLQLYSLEKPDEAEAAFQRLGLNLRAAGVFSDAIAKACADPRGRDWRVLGWDAIEVQGVWYVWGGSRDGLPSAPGGPAPKALLIALEQKGIEARFGLAHDLSNEEGRGLAQVFKVSNGDVLRPLLDQGQVLVAMRSGL